MAELVPDDGYELEDHVEGVHGEALARQVGQVNYPAGNQF
jgi:hypothetical protein